MNLLLKLNYVVIVLKLYRHIILTQLLIYDQN